MALSAKKSIAFSIHKNHQSSRFLFQQKINVKHFSMITYADFVV